MILLDWFGIIVSSFFLGPLYIVYIFILSVLQETVRVMVALAVNARIEKVLIGGLFSFTSFKGIDLADGYGAMVLLSGPLFCFLIYLLAGGIGKNQKNLLLNPLVKVKKPLAMVSLRLALVSFILSCWQIIRHL